MRNGGRLLHRCAGVSTIFHAEADGKFTIEHRSDVEPVLELNKDCQNSGNDGYNKSRSMVHCATIPAVFVDKWKKEGLDVYAMHDPEMRKKLYAKLNSSEFRGFRTNNLTL